MEKYVVGSKILKKEQVLISMFLIAILVLSSGSMVARAASNSQSADPKTVVSGIPPWELTTIASDSFGNLYYVVSPSSTMANLYELPVGSNTPKLLFTESNPSTAYVSIGWLSFDAFGDVNFLTTQVYPTDSSGNTVVNTQAYRLGAFDYGPVLLYSASMTTGCGIGFDTECIQSGDAVVGLATNPTGDVAITATRQCTSSCTFGDGYVISIPFNGKPSIRADLGDVYVDPGGFTSALDNRGNYFFGVLSNTPCASCEYGFPFETLEVTASGRIVVLDSTPGDNYFITTDLAGNVFLQLRTISPESSCPGVATDTTITIKEFTWQSLLKPSPTGVVISQETYPEYVFYWTGNNDQFRASISDTLYWILLPSTMASCTSSLSANLLIYSLKPGAAHPVAVVSEIFPANTGVYDGSSLGVFDQSFYYASYSAGAIYLVQSW